MSKIDIDYSSLIEKKLQLQNEIDEKLLLKIDDFIETYINKLSINDLLLFINQMITIKVDTKFNTTFERNEYTFSGARILKKLKKRHSNNFIFSHSYLILAEVDETYNEIEFGTIITKCAKKNRVKIKNLKNIFLIS